MPGGAGRSKGDAIVRSAPLGAPCAIQASFIATFFPVSRCTHSAASGRPARRSEARMTLSNLICRGMRVRIAADETARLATAVASARSCAAISGCAAPNPQDGASRGRAARCRGGSGASPPRHRASGRPTVRWCAAFARDRPTGRAARCARSFRRAAAAAAPPSPRSADGRIR